MRFLVGPSTNITRSAKKAEHLLVSSHKEYLMASISARKSFESIRIPEAFQEAESSTLLAKITSNSSCFS